MGQSELQCPWATRPDRCMQLPIHQKKHPKGDDKKMKKKKEERNTICIGIDIGKKRCDTCMVDSTGRSKHIKIAQLVNISKPKDLDKSMTNNTHENRRLQYR